MGDIGRPLAEVIAGLDRAFAGAPKPPVIEGCPCCTDEDELAVLLATPRRELSAQQLSSYGASALNTVGGPADFRYFAPRLLELVLGGDEMPWPDVELVFLKLARAGWTSWDEAPALLELMDALWADVLTRDPSRIDAGTVLCALGGAQDSIRNRLDAWSELQTIAAVRSLHDFVTSEVRTKRGRLVPVNAFWDSGSTTYAELSAWLSEGPAASAVEAAFERHDSEEALELLATIHDVLDQGTMEG